jgi:hypothetical protein
MTPMTDDQIKQVLNASSVNALVVRIVRAVEDHHAPDIADLQDDLARYMTIAGEESARADRAEADKAAAVEAMRDACLAIVGPMASSNSPYAANAGQAAYNAIRALPPPPAARGQEVDWRKMSVEKPPFHTPVLLAQDWHGRRWVSFTGGFLSDEQVDLLSKELPAEMQAMATDHPVITHWAHVPDLPALAPFTGGGK